MGDEGCAVCGAPLPLNTRRPNRPRIICDNPECMREVNRYGALKLNAQRRRKAAERPARTERRCPRCSETKPLTTEHWYVDRRDPATGEVTKFNRWCKVCKRAYQREVSVARSEYDRAKRRRTRRARQEAIRADPERLKVYRAKQAASARRRRKLNRKREREIQARYREKLRADEQRLAAHREVERINRRLRSGAATPRLVARAPRHVVIPRLPAGPLVAQIRERIDQEDRALGLNDPLHREAHVAKEIVVRDLGVSTRDYDDWRNGKRNTVTFDVVDRVLQAGGWLWWDVWTPKNTDPVVLATIEHSFSCTGCPACRPSPTRLAAA